MMPPLVVIVGETGSGKTALAIELAKHFNAEIISADSRTVYKGMDIGTAKPTIEEREGVPHYGFDIVEPGQQFTAYDFKRLALSAINDITSRGKLPIIVGGTGLYADSLLYDFKFRASPELTIRSSLQGLSVQELQEKVLASNLPLPENKQNPRHLSRLLESGEPPNQPKILREHTLALGLSVPQDELKQRIAWRVEAMIAAGLLDEVAKLVETYGDVEALRAPGYKAIAIHQKGELTIAEAKKQFIRDDLRLAKRQRTWFKRSKDIQWLTGDDKTATAIKLVTAFLAAK